MKFNELFLRVFEFCALYDNSNASINMGDDRSTIMVYALHEIAACINLHLENENLNSVYKVVVSRGKPSMPRVPWIAIIRKNGKVYNTISVSICFGRAGNGIVIGLMKPVQSDNYPHMSIKRAVGPDFIDVDSNRPSTSYNLRFINPVELRYDEISESTVKELLMKSIALENLIHEEINEK